MQHMQPCQFDSSGTEDDDYIPSLDGFKTEADSHGTDKASWRHTGAIYLEKRDGKKSKLPSSYFNTYLFKKQYREEKLSLPSYRDHPYCQDMEEDESDCFAVNYDVKSKSLSMVTDTGKCVHKLNNVSEKKKGIYKAVEFTVGDLDWAKSGKRYPAWPAIVIDPMLQAPEVVLSSCVPDALCVMYFGYSKNGTQRISGAY